MSIKLSKSLSIVSFDDYTIQSIVAKRKENPDQDCQSVECAPPVSKGIIKPTLKRYLILFLFCLNSANKSYQWIQIPAGSKKIAYFYDVDNFVINGISAIFLVSFIFLSWPACFIIERIGIRKAVLVASFGTTIGSVIKCFSCYEGGGIYWLFVGQILVSISEQLIFSVPSRLTSVWFPDHQVSNAMGLSVLGIHAGISIGFVVPQLLLDGSETRADIGHGLELMFYGTAALSIFAFLANCLFFDEAPKHAPGAARLKQMEQEKLTSTAGRSIWSDICALCQRLVDLLNNKQIVLLNISYGVMLGVNSTILTVLNQMIEPLWPDNDIFIGNAGFCIMIFGAVGSAFWGRILDRTRKYLFTNVALTLATIVILVYFAYSICYTTSEMAVYIAAALLGIVQVGLMVAGMELAVEMSYPAPELVTASLMNVTPQIFGTIFIFIASYIVDTHGSIAATVFYVVCCLISLVLLLCIKEDLKRQKAVIEKDATIIDKKPTITSETPYPMVTSDSSS